MILAKNTDGYSRESYANIDSISKIMRIGKKKARTIINNLYNFKIAFPSVVKIDRPYKSLNKKAHSLIFNYDETENGIYFNNDIVGNKNDEFSNLGNIFKQRESLLIIRFLIICHGEFKSKFNSTDLTLVYINNDEKNELEISSDGYNILSSKLCENIYKNPHWIRFMIGNYSEYSKEPLNKLEIKKADYAFKWLFDNGFLQKNIIALNCETCDVLYELDTKGINNPGTRNCAAIESLIRRVGLKAGRGEYPFRFFDRYAAISPAEISPAIFGLYRPTYFPTCTSLKIVQESQARQDLWQQTATTWINDLDEKTKDRK